MTVSDLIQTQKAAHKKGAMHSLKARTDMLSRLRTMISTHEKELCDAIATDFGKPYVESYITEIFTVLQEIDFHLKHLKKWIKPESAGTHVTVFPSKSEVHHRPFGTVLVISAWNYPVHLSLMPVIGALSAGNTVVLKPSELAANTSATLKKLIDQYFQNQVFSVVEGAVEETQDLLKQPFDKIFFTGSSRVGKIVMKAAAEQLIPVSLELGGKSPAIIHSDADLEIATRRIWWGKTINAGQTCVAPDYVMVHETLKSSFIETSRDVLSSFFQDDYRCGENYTRIVNEQHFERLKELLNSSFVLFGGTVNRDHLFIEPTLIESEWTDQVMQEEIFGPLLPLLTYSDPDEMVEQIRSKPAPLALYLFTNSDPIQQKVFTGISFGGGCLNETISHLGNPHLPFGGIGNSGMGSYHGKHSFDTFSHKQSILKKPVWPDPDVRYPPYDQEKLKWVKKLFS
ncbi:aldehyde dehydrogenase [Rhodohalobacter mucosus]|uniref:Aldehyde dehydrogenase n=1 Tax=Rhodohalobacter mucosus TaxID=2079485 RepID=A0A316TMH3_9BACT|nr:aldehyde dehydrogenase [Rhodohalobacter mucosus]PWN05797.1 aldehyde dehydrogenase family protein [Rhodohalobacter mucosus]